MTAGPTAGCHRLVTHEIVMCKYKLHYIHNVISAQTNSGLFLDATGQRG